MRRKVESPRGRASPKKAQGKQIPNLILGQFQHNRSVRFREGEKHQGLSRVGAVKGETEEVRYNFITLRIGGKVQN